MTQETMYITRIACSGMFRHASLVRTAVSGERRASIITVTSISELGTTLTMKNGVC
jgi:hypothetical protein